MNSSTGYMGLAKYVTLALIASAGLFSSVNMWTGTNSFTGQDNFKNGTMVINQIGTHSATISALTQNQNSSYNVPTSYLTKNTLAVVPQTNSTTNSTAQTFTISSAYQMENSPIFIKPQVTGKIIISYNMPVSDNTINGGCNVEIQYGTWPAPKTGAAVSGTTIGLNATFTSATANEVGVIPFQYTVSGLTQGTSYWIEPAVKAAGAGGTCKIINQVAVVTER